VPLAYATRDKQASCRAKVAFRLTTRGHGWAPIELAAGLLGACGRSKRLRLNSVASIAATARLIGGQMAFGAYD
jgi:hypothetical protein